MGRRARRRIRRITRRVRRVARRVVRGARDQASSRGVLVRGIRRTGDFLKDDVAGGLSRAGRDIGHTFVPKPPDMGGISEAIDRQTDLTQKEIEAGREQEARAAEQNKKNLFNIYQEQTGTNLNFLEGETLEGTNNLEFQGGQFGSMPGQKKKRKKGITW